MNRKLTVSVSIGAISFAILLMLQIQLSNGDDFCQNIDVTEYNPSLPISHPINRCASVDQNNVSWTSWFSGRSRYEFHYLDLLELLSRSADEKSATPTRAN